MISKSIQAEKKKEKIARMGVAQLGEQAQQSVPPLLVGNQYGSNMSMLDQIPDDVQMDQFETFIHESGLSWDEVLGIGNVPSLEEVDQWKKEYKYGKSLYNPTKLYELGT
jgi:hypothetical protein